MIAKGLASTDHPVMAHIVPIRRCNLSCAYCNEYDDHSKPVPLAIMRDRIDWLAALGTSVATISGGEPLLARAGADPVGFTQAPGARASGRGVRCSGGETEESPLIHWIPPWR